MCETLMMWAECLSDGVWLFDAQTVDIFPSKDLLLFYLPPALSRTLQNQDTLQSLTGSCHHRRWRWVTALSWSVTWPALPLLKSHGPKTIKIFALGGIIRSALWITWPTWPFWRQIKPTRGDTSAMPLMTWGRTLVPLISLSKVF